MWEGVSQSWGGALLTATCSDSMAGPSTTQDPYAQFACESAPIEQRSSLSAVPLSLEPYPVTAQASIRLVIGATEENPTMVGWGAAWQCWDGSVG